MFKKVLIIDDQDDINKSVLELLMQHKAETIESAQYCDDAYLKIKNAKNLRIPYDLIITDLSFKKDYRESSINSGEELIMKLRRQGDTTPIIVYSMKDQLQRVRLLVKTFKINAYVCKDRKGSKELYQAISAVADQRLFLSPQIAAAILPKTDLEITDYDIELSKQLSLGKDQKGISAYFTEKNIKPNSISSVEKRLGKLRIKFKAENATHLVSKMKDLGLI